MAKKREWKAWMVVDKRTGKPRGGGQWTYATKPYARLCCTATETVVRVRIVEDK